MRPSPFQVGINTCELKCSRTPCPATSYNDAPNAPEQPRNAKAGRIRPARNASAFRVRADSGAAQRYTVRQGCDPRGGPAQPFQPRPGAPAQRVVHQNFGLLVPPYWSNYCKTVGFNVAFRSAKVAILSRSGRRRSTCPTFCRGRTTTVAQNLGHTGRSSAPWPTIHLLLESILSKPKTSLAPVWTRICCELRFLTGTWPRRRMVDFAGWAMPVQYTSIIQEHNATRNAVAITDISHMGRLRFEGPGAAVFLAELLTRRVADMELGQIRYSLVTNEQGGILDDVLVGYYHDSYGQPFYVVVVNASNRQKIVDWVRGHLPRERVERPGHEVIFTDVSPVWAMFAIQGPKSIDVLQPLVNIDLLWMRYYRGSRRATAAPRRAAARRNRQPHGLHRRGRL